MLRSPLPCSRAHPAPAPRPPCIHPRKHRIERIHLKPRGMCSQDRRETAFQELEDTARHLNSVLPLSRRRPTLCSLVTGPHQAAAGGSLVLCPKSPKMPLRALEGPLE